MPQMKTILLAAVWLVGITIVANAQAQQRPAQRSISFRPHRHLGATVLIRAGSALARNTRRLT
jgi:hypothetical protein